MVFKKGCKFSEEHKKKLSKNHANFSGENHPMFGKHHSQKTKEKISKNLSGRYNGEYNPFYGKHHTEETKKLISEKLSGENHPLYGKHQSDKSKLKSSLSNTGKKRSKETINKLSESHKNKPNLNKGKKLPQISGNKHPNWKGGISFEPYCYKFNNTLKRSIRERDSYQCQNPNCLCTQLENLLLYKCSLDIHHIHYDKENCYPDLISLCHSCNVIVNSNREYWEKLFMSILIKRGLCKPS